MQPLFSTSFAAAAAEKRNGAARAWGMVGYTDNAQGANPTAGGHG